MAYALVSGSSTYTELGGKHKIVTAKVTPDGATGSITFSDYTTVHAILGFGFNDDMTANCYTMQAAIDGTTVNKVNFKLWKAGGTAADTAYVGFWVSVLAS